MALLFDADGEKVDHGSASDLDSMAVGTLLYIVRPSVVNTNHHIFRKGIATFSRLLFGSTGNIEFGKHRTTTNLTVVTTGTPVTANVWQAIAASWNLSGADGDQHLYHGNLGGAITEQAYGLRVVGSGTHDDAASDWTVGCRSDTGAAAFRGEIARQQVWDRQLSLSEINIAVYEYLSGSILHSEYGYNGVGTQVDYSGKGHAGTVTGATEATSHAPVALAWDPPSDFMGLAGIGTHPTISADSPVGEWDSADTWAGPTVVVPEPSPPPSVFSIGSGGSGGVGIAVRPRKRKKTVSVSAEALVFGSAAFGRTGPVTANGEGRATTAGHSSRVSVAAISALGIHNLQDDELFMLYLEI